MDRFLDKHGVLDADYERAAETDIRFRALLLPGRDPSPVAGDTLVVVDSSEGPGLLALSSQPLGKSFAGPARSAPAARADPPRREDPGAAATRGAATVGAIN